MEPLSSIHTTPSPSGAAREERWMGWRGWRTRAVEPLLHCVCPGVSPRMPPVGARPWQHQEETAHHGTRRIAGEGISPAICGVLLHCCICWLMPLPLARGQPVSQSADMPRPGRVWTTRTQNSTFGQLADQPVDDRRRDLARLPCPCRGGMPNPARRASRCTGLTMRSTNALLAHHNSQHAFCLANTAALMQSARTAGELEHITAHWNPLALHR